MLVSKVLFSTADSADNTYTQKYMRQYVFCWIIGIILITICACQCLSSSSGLSKLARKTIAGSVKSCKSDRLSDRMSDARSDKTERRVAPIVSLTGASDIRPDKAGRSDTRADTTTSYKRYSSHHSTKSSGKRSS